MGLFKGESYPIAENLSRNGFYLPSGVGLKNGQLKYIVKMANEIPVPIMTILLFSLPKNCDSRINEILPGTTTKLIILIASIASTNLGKKLSIKIGAINIPRIDMKIEKIIIIIFTCLLLVPVASSGSKYL